MSSSNNANREIIPYPKYEPDSDSNSVESYDGNILEDIHSGSKTPSPKPKKNRKSRKRTKEESPEDFGSRTYSPRHRERAKAAKGYTDRYFQGESRDFSDSSQYEQSRASPSPDYEFDEPSDIDGYGESYPDDRAKMYDKDPYRSDNSARNSRPKSHKKCSDEYLKYKLRKNFRGHVDAEVYEKPAHASRDSVPFTNERDLRYSNESFGLEPESTAYTSSNLPEIDPRYSARYHSWPRRDDRSFPQAQMYATGEAPPLRADPYPYYEHEDSNHTSNYSKRLFSMQFRPHPRDRHRPKTEREEEVRKAMETGDVWRSVWKKRMDGEDFVESLREESARQPPEWW
ncbi:hypothetical protein CC80DRAFT_550034 [Byssothecium circinans]|uniref:Uncharacterized protein n=1 Tax=Byssothecium circinans TaxID=147558 RepID=A0A6A5TSA0_9PLEO|nr:hypothetical protein CC80DRAFT_550034 [Byssothecium circinans]